MVTPPVIFRSAAYVASLLPLFVGVVQSVSPQALSGQADPDRHPLELASEYYAGLDSFCMEFNQRLEVPLLGKTHESRGTFCQQMPDRVRMDFHDPEGDLIIGDGEFLWVFLPSEVKDQVQRFSLESADGAFDLRREFLDEPLTRYEVTDQGSEVIGGRDTQAFGLVPRERVGYREATVWIDVDTHYLLQFQIVDVSGSIRRMTFSDFVPDPNLAEGAFTFEVPPGVRVVNR